MLVAAPFRIRHEPALEAVAVATVAHAAGLAHGDETLSGHPDEEAVAFVGRAPDVADCPSAGEA